jgi:hypothetical protein
MMQLDDVEIRWNFVAIKFQLVDMHLILFILLRVSSFVRYIINVDLKPFVSHIIKGP